MNYLQNERNNSRHNLDLSNQRRQFNHIPYNQNNSKGKTNETRKGISLTPDRRTFYQNPKQNNYNNSNSSNYKINPREINIRNFSSKKSEQNIPKFYDNGNTRENVNQKDTSQISHKNDYNYNEYSTISRMSNKSSAQNYLDRRHIESQQRLNKIRHDKFTQESSELKFKPKISDNSKKIIQNLTNKERAVKINPNLNPNPLTREHYKNNNDSRLSENRNQYDNGYNPNAKINQNKYSQFEDYRKIVEKREMMQNNSQRNTLENESRQRNPVNQIRPSSANPNNCNYNRNNTNESHLNITNNSNRSRNEDHNYNNNLDRQIINNSENPSPNRYRKTNSYIDENIKNNSASKQSINKNTSIKDQSFSSNRNQEKNYNSQGFKVNKNIPNDKKYQSMGIPPRNSSHVKRPNSNYHSNHQNNTNNSYSLYMQNNSKRKVNRESSFNSEKENSRNSTIQATSKKYSNLDGDEVNDARKKLNEFYNTDKNNTYVQNYPSDKYENNNRNDQNYSTDNFNVINRNNSTNLNRIQRDNQNFINTPERTIQHTNINQNYGYIQRKETEENDKKSNLNNFRERPNTADYSRVKNNEYQNNNYKNQQFNRNTNNNNQNLNNKNNNNLPSTKNNLLESQANKIDFNEFDQFSPPNNPIGNINYKETEEKEREELKNQPNFDSKLNFNHQRKTDVNVLKNFADNLKPQNNYNTNNNPSEYYRNNLNLNQKNEDINLHKQASSNTNLSELSNTRSNYSTYQNQNYSKQENPRNFNNNQKENMGIYYDSSVDRFGNKINENISNYKQPDYLKKMTEDIRMQNNQIDRKYSTNSKIDRNNISMNSRNNSQLQERVKDNNIPNNNQNRNGYNFQGYSNQPNNYQNLNNNTKNNFNQNDFRNNNNDQPYKLDINSKEYLMARLNQLKSQDPQLQQNNNYNHTNNQFNYN